MLEQITTAYTLTDDFLRARSHREHPLRQMSDAEVLTIALTAARFFHGCHEHARAYFREHRLAAAMLSKSQFSRRLSAIASLVGDLQAVLGRAFADGSTEGMHEPVFAVDTMPIEAIDLARAERARRYPAARRGEKSPFLTRSSTKGRFWFGLKLHVVVDRLGRPVEAMLTPAAVADVRGLHGLPLDLPRGSALLADKAYSDAETEQMLAEHSALALLPLRQTRMRRQHAPAVADYVLWQRRVVETAFSRLAAMMPRSIHSVTARGFEIKTMLFVLAFAFDCLVR